MQASMALNNALLYEDVKIQKQEVEKRKTDLERFYELTVGRELKMIELKDRVRQLEMNTRQEN